MSWNADRNKNARGIAVMSNTEWKHDGVAIVGIGCRFPGATDPQEFWRLLEDGRDLVQEIPSERFDWATYYDPDPDTPGRTNSRWGGFITDIAGFDAGFFGISPREATTMDPQQRLLLEAGWDALTDAGIGPSTLAGTRTGVFVGVMATSYLELQERWQRTVYSVTGSTRSVLAGRLSYALDLRGPSVSIDTACSSSLVAAHAGYRSVRDGESDMALIAGVNMVLSPEESIVYSSAGILASDGRCKFGDMSGDGFVRSDGVGVVVLKPLARAVADGDRIYAVIRGSAVNSDGQGSGYLLTPAKAGQVDLLRQAWADAGVHPRDLDYIEAHGTGTRIGDPVELRGLEELLRGHRSPQLPCRVGSVKTNIGHSEGAAGIAGLIKTALCVHHGRIPASLHLKTPNLAIDWEKAPLALCHDSVAWPRHDGREAIAGVSSFGISGSNAHIVLAQAPEPKTAGQAEGMNATDSDRAMPPHLRNVAADMFLPVSVADPHALHALAGAYVGQLEHMDRAGVARICAAAARRRDHYPHRLAVTATDGPGLAGALRAAMETSFPVLDSAAPAAEIIFVFSGQGAQWSGMARGLYRAETAFRASLEQCDAAVARETDWSVIDVLVGESGDAWLERTDMVQPILWAVQVSLAALWRSWGVRPQGVVGHSMGEVAAAHVAGALSTEDAARIICRRSQLASSVPQKGAMAVVSMSGDALAARIAAFYPEQLSVAAYNSPRKSIVSGDAAAVHALVAELGKDGISGCPIRVDYASHSGHMDVLREKLLGELVDISPRETSVRFYSTVRSTELLGPELGAAYWTDNLREPVRFAETITTLAAGDRTIFLEVSPHPVLAGSVRECLDAAQRKGLVLHSTRRDEPELGVLYAQAADLYREGVTLDWEGIYPGPTPHADLPRYPWQHEHFWIREEQAAVGSVATRPTPKIPAPHPAHPLLAARQDHGSFLRWEAAPAPEAIRYLYDHRIQGVAVMPGTLYLELVHSAVRDIRATVGTVELRNVRFPVGLFLDDSTHPVFRVELRPARSDETVQPGVQEAETWHFEVQVSETEQDVPDWTVQATGTALAMPETLPGRLPDIADVRRRCVNRLSAAEFYQTAERNGNQWRGLFQGVAEIWSGQGELLATIDAASDPTCEWDRYAFHPALLDACAHVLSALKDQANAASPDSRSRLLGAFVGGSIEVVRFHRRPERLLLSYATLRSGGPDTLRGDVSIRTPAGEPVAELLGVTNRFFDSQTPDFAASRLPRPANALDAAAPGSPADWLHTVEWRAIAPAPARTNYPTRWLLYSGDREQARRVQNCLPGNAILEEIESLAMATGADSRTDEEGTAHLFAEDHRLPGEGPLGVVCLLPAATGSRREDDDSGAQACHQLTRLLRLLTATRLRHGARLWVITRGTQPAVPEDTVPHPAMAALWGMGRAMALEAPELACTLIDLPEIPADDEPAVLARELCVGPEETQVALRGGRRLVPRLTAITLQHTPGHAAQTSSAGDPQTVPHPHDAGLAPADILIDVRARSPLATWHIAAPDMEGHASGTHNVCAGSVVATGSAVRGIATGDDVLALTPTSAGRLRRSSAMLSVPLPRTFTPADITAMTGPYLSAYDALFTHAGLRHGERILIHATPADVTLALIRLARTRDCDVYVIAQNPSENAVLRLAGANVVARTGDLASDLRAATGGRGLDIIIGTDDEETTRACLQLLCLGGRQVVLASPGRGTRPDHAAPAIVDRAVSWTVGVGTLAAARPAYAAELLRQVSELISAGACMPLPPGTGTTQATPLRDAAAVASTSAQHAGGPVRQDAGYLITGGLGDLGRIAADWLIRQGARHILVVGRSPHPAPSDPAPRLRLAAIQAWQAQGAEVVYRQADVADESAISAVLRQWAGEGRPAIRGVLHMAGVLTEQLLADLEPADLDALLRPKLHGGSVLHRTIGQEELDFFVLYSSSASVLSSPMLGGYAAANAALDALAAHRRARGRPAISIGWGFWTSIGMCARLEIRTGRSRIPIGMHGFSPEQGSDALDLLLKAGAGQDIRVLPADWPEWAAAHSEAAQVPIMRELVSGSDPSLTSSRRQQFRPPTPSAPQQTQTSEPVARDLAPLPAVAVGDKVHELAARVLGLPPNRMDRSRPLKQLGLDSLMATELRNLVRRELDAHVPIVELLRGASVDEVANVINDSSRRPPSVAPTASAPSVVPAETL